MTPIRRTEEAHPKPGWLERQFQQAKKTMDELPDWMKTRPQPMTPIRTPADCVKWLRKRAGMPDGTVTYAALHNAANDLEVAIAATPPTEPLERASKQHAKAVNVILKAFADFRQVSLSDGVQAMAIIARLADVGLLLCETDEVREDTLPASPWQPISTAPRDGTRILVFENGVVADVAWEGGPGGWISHRDRGWAVEYNPTHWMPLP